MKSYTDLDQSRKLAEFLPIESADMYYFLDPTPAGNIYHIVIPRIDFGVRTKEPEYNEGDIPCWSLTALMNVLDRGATFKTPKGWACQSYIEFKAITSDYYSNPIDACVAMIKKLHEQKLL
jgi:hypothetical protein